MKITDITLTTSPTIVIDKDYIKAGAALSFTPSPDESLEAATKMAKTLLNKLYFEALKLELINVTKIQKRKSRLRVVRWLKGAINGEKDSQN